MSQPPQLPAFSRAKPRASDASLEFGGRLVKEEHQHSRSPSPRKSDLVGATLAARVGLSHYRQQLLLQSWPKVQHVVRRQGNEAFFKKLCDKSEIMKETFQKAYIVHGFASPKRPDIYVEHSQLLIQLISDTLNAFSDKGSGDQIVERCRDYGAKHVQLDGITFIDNVWDEMCESLVEEVVRMTVVRKHRELSKAWTALITFLMDHLKHGYAEGKRSRRQSSAPFCCIYRSQVKDVPTIDVHHERSESEESKQ